MSKSKVLIAGVAGASLGTELAKCLRIRPDLYELHAADIDPMAYGLHAGPLFDRAFVVPKDDYIPALTNYCQTNEVSFIIPGADITAKLLSTVSIPGTTIIGNNNRLVVKFQSKHSLFRELCISGTRVCPSWDITNYRDVYYPAVIKPANDSGGSVNCFLVENHEQARYILDYLLELGIDALLQEYVPGREFTVGVLHDHEGNLIGSVAMEKILSSKLTIHQKNRIGVLSSGYSQGHFRPWSSYINGICEQLASNIGSTGPLNVQARVNKRQQFIVFEVNARFSASCYLRSLAGFNEPHLYLEHLRGHTIKRSPITTPCTVLRSLTEKVVDTGELSKRLT